MKSMVDIQVVDDFLTATECADLISMAETKLAPSLTYDEQDLCKENRVRRTSETAWLNGPDVAWLSARVAKHSSTPACIQQQVQVVRYKTGGFFTPHYDHCVSSDRIHTYLMYLNDDFEGGETHFPVIDKTILPKKGKLAKFTNIDNKGSVIKCSYHGGNKVVSGVKWICTVWILTGIPVNSPLRKVIFDSDMVVVAMKNGCVECNKILRRLATEGVPHVVFPEPATSKGSWPMVFVRGGRVDTDLYDFSGLSRFC